MGGTEKGAGWPGSTAAGRTDELSVPEVYWQATVALWRDYHMSSHGNCSLSNLRRRIYDWVDSPVSAKGGAEKKENRQT